MKKPHFQERVEERYNQLNFDHKLIASAISQIKNKEALFVCDGNKFTTIP